MKTRRLALVHRYIMLRRRDWVTAFASIAIYVVALTVTFVIYWPAGFVVTVLGALLLIAWHRNTTAYQCLHCGNAFEISFLTALVTPHGISRNPDGTARGWKYLRCPHCGKRSRATALLIVDDAAGEAPR